MLFGSGRGGGLLLGVDGGRVDQLAAELEDAAEDLAAGAAAGAALALGVLASHGLALGAPAVAGRGDHDLDRGPLVLADLRERSGDAGHRIGLEVLVGLQRVEVLLLQRQAGGGHVPLLRKDVVHGNGRDLGVRVVRVDLFLDQALQVQRHADVPADLAAAGGDLEADRVLVEDPGGQAAAVDRVQRREQLFRHADLFGDVLRRAAVLVAVARDPDLQQYPFELLDDLLVGAGKPFEHLPGLVGQGVRLHGSLRPARTAGGSASRAGPGSRLPPGRARRGRAWRSAGRRSRRGAAPR